MHPMPGRHILPDQQRKQLCGLYPMQRRHLFQYGRGQLQQRVPNVLREPVVKHYRGQQPERLSKLYQQLHLRGGVHGRFTVLLCVWVLLRAKHPDMRRVPRQFVLRGRQSY